MMEPMNQIDRQHEMERIIAFYGEDQPARMMEALERQFMILHNRAQVLLGLAGIVVTTTGFSGRIIAGTNVLAQVLIIAGVALTLLAAGIVVWGVLHLRWLTQQPGELLRPWLMTCLTYRDMKTGYYRIGIVLLLLGLAAYVAAIAVMLVNPEVDAVPMVR